VSSPGQPDQSEIVIGEATVTVRRSPRYPRFMILGAIVGVILALVFTVAFPENEKFDRAQIFGFLLLAGVAFGVALGAAVALVLDRIVSRSATTVVADRLAPHVSSALGAAPDASSGSQPSGESHSNANTE
jgi:hypothetical protein